MAGTSSITTVLSVRLPNGIYEEVAAMAYKEGVERSDLIRDLIMEALDARRKWEKRQGKKP